MKTVVNYSKIMCVLSICQNGIFHCCITAIVVQKDFNLLKNMFSKCLIFFSFNRKIQGKMFQF